MSDRLFLRLAPDGSRAWLRGGAAHAQPGAPPAAVLAQAREIIVLVPATDVLLTAATLTARNRAQLLKALPYAIEDLLLAPVEELHFAAAAPQDGRVGVAVVARATLTRWLDELDAAGISADVLVPETLALPAADAAALLIEDTRACARLAPWSAFACSLAELPGFLAQLDARPPFAVHDCRVAPRLALPVTVDAYHERAGEALVAGAREHLAPVLARRPVGLTLQVDEGQEAFDGKFGNLHPLFEKQ